MYAIYRRRFQDALARDGQGYSREIEPVHCSTLKTARHANAYVAKALRRADAAGREDVGEQYVVRNVETGMEYTFNEWAAERDALPWED